MLTNWNLSVFYTSLNDPKIERDMRAIEASCARFAKKYKKRVSYLKNDKALYFAIKDYEKLITETTGKPLIFVHLTHELDSTNTESEALLNKYSERLTKASNLTLFFYLNLGKIPAKIQKKLLKSPRLKNYKYMLERIFKTSKYNLTEPEEKIIGLLGAPSFSFWTSGVEKAEGRRSVVFEGEELPIPEALNKIQDLPTDKRRELHRLTMEKLHEVSEFAESELNAIYTGKKILDELRGHKEAYEATILSYENDKNSVLRLVDTVSKHFHLSNRFYEIKRNILGVPRLKYADRAAKIGSVSKKIDFETASMMLRETLHKTRPEYAEIFENFLKNGQIDVYPKKGKSGGAYCAGFTLLPTFVLLNHVDSMDSYLTLAHEMGHAIHTELSKKQPLVYQDYSISVAETASTFFERLAFDAVFETLSEKEKVIALHNKIQDDVQTIFRQIAFFNFERDLHNKVRAEGFVSKEAIGSLLNDHMKRYLGEAFDLDEKDGNFFVTVSHFRRFFYVYSYAYGQLISKALFNAYKKDQKFIEKINQFLSAGGSKSPENIFKSIGVDTLKPGFFEAGLKEIEGDIKKLEKISK